MATTLLSTTLNDASSITSPTIGLGGEVAGFTFASGADGTGSKGLRCLKPASKYARFPISCIDLVKGKISFSYKPSYTLSTNLKRHVILGIGEGFISTPKMYLQVVNSIVELIVETSSGTKKLTTPSTLKWTKDKWVKITIEYDTTIADSLKLTIGTSTFSVSAGVFSLLSMPTTAKLHLGGFGEDCPYFAGGTIDNLETTKEDVIVLPPPPPPPPPPSGEWEPIAGQHLLLNEVGAVVPKTSVVAPTHNGSYIDPDFGGLSIRRMTVKGGPVYSQLQAFSQDEKYAIVVIGGQGYQVIDVATGLQVDAIANNPIWQTERYAPRWYNNKVYFFGSPNPCKLYSIDMLGNAQLVWTGPADHPFFKADRVEEMISENGITMAYVYAPNQTSRKFIAIDLNTGLTKQTLDFNSLPNVFPGSEPNWVAVSPLGKYIVLAWAVDGSARSRGMELFDIDTGAYVRNVYQGHSHGDMCVLPDGREAYLTPALYTSDPALHYFDGSAVKVVRQMAWGSFGHASCRGPKNWVLMTGDSGEAGWTPYVGQDELYLMRLTGPKAGELVRLAHHRSEGGDPEVSAEMRGYWAQPKATWSVSGRLMAWNENCGSGAPWCAVATIGS